MSKNTYDNNDGSYVVKKSRKSSVFAFIVCFLIAFVIWAYTASYGANVQSSNDNGGHGDTGVPTTQQPSDAQ